MNDEEISELNNEIISILNSLETHERSYNKIEEDISALKRSINWESGEYKRIEREYKCMLDKCICEKMTSKQAVSDNEFLRCCGEYEQHKRVMKRFDTDMNDILTRKQKLEKLIDNYNNQLEIKREQLEKKLSKYLN